MQRRDLLKGLAATGVGFAASRSPVRRLVELVPPDPRISAYEETFKLSACNLCPAGCGIRARIVDGHVAGICGNPLDPISNGGLCTRGLALLDQFYHPDRLKKPLRRVGNRGSGRFEPIEWDEAIEAIATRMASLPLERTVFIDGRPEGFHHLLIERFMRHLGSPYHLADRFDGAIATASEMMMGRRFVPAYEPAELDLIVSVGDPFLDHSMSPCYYTSQFAEFRQGRERHGELVLFDDTGGVTAHKANETHFLEPGTHAVTLLALCNVIVRFGWYDRQMAESRMKGLLEWRGKVLDRYSPEQAEALTGVQSEVFYEVARRLSSARHKVVTVGPHALSGPGAVQTGMAMLALNLLIGAVDEDLHLLEPLEGMIALDPPPPPAVRGESLVADLAPLAGGEAWLLPEVVAADAAAVSALFLYESDPVGSQPSRSRWTAALDKIPLVVSFSPFLDETARRADFVLPESHCLERYQEFIHPPISKIRRVSIAAPLWDEPRYDTRHPGDVLLELGRRIGKEGEAVFPWGDYAEYLDACLAELYGLGSGSVFVTREKLEAKTALAKRGFWQDVSGDADTFLDAVYESGGFVDLLYVAGQWRRMVATPSGKIELVSSVMRTAVTEFLSRTKKSLDDLGLGQVAESYFMPDAVRGALPPKVAKAVWLIAREGRSAAELSSWWEIVGMHNYLQWTMWAEAGAEAGTKTEMLERRIVRFKMAGWDGRLPVVFHAGQPTGIIALPLGFPEGRDSSTPLPLGHDLASRMPYVPDPLTGLPSLYVKLDKLAFDAGPEGES